MALWAPLASRLRAHYTITNKAKSEYVVLAAAVSLLGAVAVDEEEEEKRETRGVRQQLWSREWLLRRKEGTQYRNLVHELALEDTESYRNWMRVSRTQFHWLLGMIHRTISKRNT